MGCRLEGDVPHAAPLFISMARKDVYEVRGISIIWLLMTMAASGILAIEMIHKYVTVGNTGVLNMLTTGFDFDVIVDSTEDNSAAGEQSCCTSLQFMGYVFKSIFEVGVVVAESALPTAQAFPSWFLVDMVAVGTFETFWLTMLPRLSGLALFGVLFNGTHITLRIVPALLAFILYVASLSIGLSLIAWHDLDTGDGNTTLYFFWPVIALLASITLMAVGMVAIYINGEQPKWATDAHIQVDGGSLYRLMLLRFEAPMWVQVVMNVEQKHGQSVDIVNLWDTLVDWNSSFKPEAPDQAVLDLSVVGSHEESQKTVLDTVPAEVITRTKAEAGDLSPFGVATLTLRRMTTMRKRDTTESTLTQTAEVAMEFMG